MATPLPRRHSAADLRFPPPGVSAYSPERIEATVALFDAIAMDHPLFVRYAIQNGAEVRAVVRAGNTWHQRRSALDLAVEALCILPSGQPAHPGPRVSSGVIDLLIEAGADDPLALRRFPLQWGGNPRVGNSQIYRQVEAAGLNAIRRQSAGSPLLAPGIDGSNAARVPVQGVPWCTWLVVAIEHQRLDVVQHWFAQNAPINGPHSVSGQWLSPLAIALGALVVPQTTANGTTRAIARTVVDAWQVAPDDLCRQEALALAVVYTDWSKERALEATGWSHPAHPVQASELATVRSLLVTTLAQRSISMAVNPDELQNLPGTDPAAFRTAFFEVWNGLEQDVLRTIVERELPTLDASAPRARL